MKDLKAPTGIILSKPVCMHAQAARPHRPSLNLSQVPLVPSSKLLKNLACILLCAFGFLSIGAATIFFENTPEEEIVDAGSELSLASLGGRFRKAVNGDYSVDSEYLLEKKPSLLEKVAGSIGMSSRPAAQPQIIRQQKPVYASAVMNVSGRAKPMTSLKPLVADKYESYSLVSRKLMQIIKRRGRKDVDPQSLAQKIIFESRRANFDPLFVAAVIKSESAFDRFAVSSAGARGLMQIMPSTGSFIAGLEGFESIMKRRLTDPDYNVQLGIAYLKYLQQMYKGNRVLVLTAYNWGPGRVQDAIEARRKIPREVMNYALKILKDYQEWVNEIVMAA